MGRLDSVVQRHHDERSSSIAAAQRAKVVLSRGYAKGWCRTSDMNPHRDANDSRIGLAVLSVIPPMLWWQRDPPARRTRYPVGSLAWAARPLSSVVSILSQGLQRRRHPREGA